MAAALASIRTALTCLGFSPAAALAMIDEQDMDSLEEFELLNDKQVEQLCTVVRKPGGTILNPQAAVAGQPAHIQNPGCSINFKAESNLKLMCYHYNTDAAYPGRHLR